MFSAANLAMRRPVLGVDRCDSASFVGLTLSGSGGAGLGLDELLAMPGVAQDPTRLAELALANAFFRASNCRFVEIRDSGLEGDRCDREMWTVVNCGKVVVRGLRSHSLKPNFASLAKFIRCNDVDVQDISVSDPGRGSLVDIIAERFRYAEVDIDYPNGKLLDVSHEWRSINAPIKAGLIENCRTTGAGVVTVHGMSSPDEIAKAPIGAITLRNVSPYFKAPSDKPNRLFMRLADARTITIVGCQIHNMAMAQRTRQPQDVTVADTNFSWDDNGDSGSREIVARGINIYRRCTFRSATAARSRLLFSAIEFSVGNVFHECLFENVVVVAATDTVFNGCTFSNAVHVEEDEL